MSDSDSSSSSEYETESSSSEYETDSSSESESESDSDIVYEYCIVEESVEEGGKAPTRRTKSSIPIVSKKASGTSSPQQEQKVGGGKIEETPEQSPLPDKSGDGSNNDTQRPLRPSARGRGGGGRGVVRRPTRGRGIITGQRPSRGRGRGRGGAIPQRPSRGRGRGIITGQRPSRGRGRGRGRGTARRPSRGRSLGRRGRGRGRAYSTPLNRSKPAPKVPPVAPVQKKED